MLKKIGIPLIVGILGLLLGYLIFGGSDSESHHNHEVSNTSGKWTCSMHPQVDGQEGGTCPLCGMDLVYMNMESTLNANQFKMGEDALALANIETITVGSSLQNSNTIKLSGEITTNKETDGIQTTLFEGRIDKFYADAIGKRIRKGQKIGLIYSPELYLAQDRFLTTALNSKVPPRLYESARNSLGMWKLTDEQIDSILKIKEPIFNFPIYADVTGTVTEVLAAEGNYYELGTPILKTSDLRTVWAVFDVYESQLNSLKVGEKITVEIPALGNKKFDAKIDFIEPIFKDEKRVVSLRVVLTNRNSELKPGMFVDGFVQKETTETANLTVPKSSVLWTGKRSVVYKKPYKDQAIFELVEVDLGNTFENSYEVLSGLQLGDEIVLEGAFTVDAAAQLNGKKSMMSIDFSEDKIKHNHHKHIKDLGDHKSIEEPTNEKIVNVVEAYLAVKNALVATDLKKSISAVLKLQEEFKNNKNAFDTKSLAFEKLNTSIMNLNSFKSMEALRAEFKPLSQNFIEVVKNSSGFNEVIYVQFCPMADGNKGATWLSLSEEIRNPYFGDKMLMCGTVQEKIN
ncbi:hypothetical protein GCM10011414_09980 [Croceivirga lutea]|uniref:efflux RND transporter periplasmic adaptor subunit n=1 Tax=Croceivirga lutea TaxID=1775167 RepID=UPI001639DE26|nr:efflux RND transporter periplasmic adaptor subunit [Croceivirga lutea]GGG42423.1 hypothetical protein GCM10011414_09980 [Croceivirga lutea]